MTTDQENHGFVHSSVLCVDGTLGEKPMTTDRECDGIVQFIDDDTSYLDWLKANRNGFVVNSDRNPAARYLKLHRATCSRLTSQSSNLTTDYIKTCSNSVATLASWAKRETGGDLQPCFFCHRNLKAPAASTTHPSAIEPTRIEQPIRLPKSQSPMPSSIGQRAVPGTISTGCPELDLVWRVHAPMILGSHIPIPDTEDDLNWHAFLGHTLDFDGFRAAEFVGVDKITRKSNGFVPLKERGVGVRELASLWTIAAIRDHLLHGTAHTKVVATLDVLRTHGGMIGQSFADSLAAFPYKKSHRRIRAYLENCHKLSEVGFSFREWLRQECERLGVDNFPPSDFSATVSLRHRQMSLEAALRRRLQNPTFFMVGPAMAAYTLADWQLSLWAEGRAQVFRTFKKDRFHEDFVEAFGRGLVPEDEESFADWWLSLYPDLPPRLANECIWLGIEEGTVKIEGKR